MITSLCCFHIAWATTQYAIFILTDDICGFVMCYALFPQAALGIMQMVEDTLIEHAHTKPLLPSQLVRYREVQLPDGKLDILTLVPDCFDVML